MQNRDQQQAARSPILALPVSESKTLLDFCRGTRHCHVVSLRINVTPVVRDGAK